jgi:hypothetical protein
VKCELLPAKVSSERRYWPLPLVADDPQATSVSDAGVDQPLGGGAVSGSHPLDQRVELLGGGDQAPGLGERVQAEQTRLAAHSTGAVGQSVIAEL